MYLPLKSFRRVSFKYRFNLSHKPFTLAEFEYMSLNKVRTKVLLALEGVGAIFVGIYLAAYLGGIPTTVVYHSELAFKIPLAIFGALILVLAAASIALALRSKKN